MTAAMLFWICWGLVALGLILVVAAVIPLSGRVRPLRRALRRLSWRRAEVDRLRARAESVQDQIATLQAQATDLAQRADLLRGAVRDAIVATDQVGFAETTRRMVASRGFSAGRARPT